MDKELEYYYNLYRLMRTDADEEEEGKKRHGGGVRYGLPYALCKSVGINTEGMKPYEAWDAWRNKVGGYQVRIEYNMVKQRQEMKRKGEPSKTFNTTACTKNLKPSNMDTSIPTLKNLSICQDVWRKGESAEAKKLYRETTEEERLAVQDNLRKLFEENDFCRNVRPKNLGLILTQGVKNQFQTHKSEGALSPVKRRWATYTLFGIEHDVNPNSYEKYGYLGKIGDAELCYGGDLEHYGDVTVSFKKDISNRTTYTIADSLYADTPAGCVDKNPTLDGIANANWFGDDTKENDYYLGGRYLVKRYSKGMPLKDVNERYCYMELQYHGDVKGTDIEKIQFKNMSAARDSFSKMTNKAKRVIKDNDIKISYFNESGEYVEVDNVDDFIAECTS